MAHEVWRDVVGYEGLYIVSNLGNIMSLPRFREKAGQKVYYCGRMLKQAITPNGYTKVTLFKDGTPKQTSVHRVVAQAFLGDSDLEVNHKNEIKTDNSVENLEYLSQRDNTRYTHCKPVESYDLETGETVKRYKGMVDAERDGHDGGAISNVCLRKKGFQSHHGLGWRFTSADVQ